MHEAYGQETPPNPGTWMQDVRPGGMVSRLGTPLVRVLGPALGGVFLISHPWVGAFLWLALFQDVRHVSFALLGLTVGEATSRMFGIRDESPIEGSLKANALLAALAVAWLTGTSGISVQAQLVVAAVSSVSAAVLTAAALKVLGGVNLPALVTGYATVAVMLFAIFPKWTEAALVATRWWPTPVDAVDWVITFFRTLGGLLYAPTVGAGMVIAAAVLLWSPISFVTGACGWVAGVIVATALGHQEVVYFWMPTAYNYFLAGMGLGAVFFLPGRYSLVRAAIGGCGASFLAVAFQHLFAGTAIGYLPIVAAVTIWTAIYALTLSGEHPAARRNERRDIAPEEAWWRCAYWTRRSGRSGPFLVVPTGSPSRIVQGTDGGFSHIGAWRHALDFADVASAGVGPSATAAIPVLAPAAGIVERVRNDVEDNSPGLMNHAQQWGNFVMIRLDQGGWAVLAHLQKGSVAVFPGARVEIGSQLGVVGNSGRAARRHLHLHVQSSPRPGDASVPFRLANFVSAPAADQALMNWHSVWWPPEGTIVARAPPVPALSRLLGSAVPGRALWAVESSGLIPRPMRSPRERTTTRVDIVLDVSGRHVMRDPDGGGMLRWSADADAWRVLELEPGSPPLMTMLALAVPSIPYAAVHGMVWEEPAPVIPIAAVRRARLAIAPYVGEPFAYVRCRSGGLLEEGEDRLVVDSTLVTPSPWLPSRLVCQVDRIRGPVRLEATFARGTLVYSQLSFEPARPPGCCPVV